MDKLLNLFVSIVSQPSILVSLIALLGLVLQKKKFSEVIQGTIKTFVGFLVLIGGAGLISNSLTPFASMFQTALHTQGVVPSNEAVVAIALLATIRYTYCFDHASRDDREYFTCSVHKI